LKLARCPHSLAALLAAFTFYVAHPIRSSMAGEYIDSLEERPVFPGEKPL
jgi:hypothetical protein